MKMKTRVAAATVLFALALISLRFDSSKQPTHQQAVSAARARTGQQLVAAGALEPSQAPSGIAGRVRGAQGTAVHGARVCASRASFLLASTSVSHCVRSDVEGRYQLRLAPDAYVVSASTKHHLPASALAGAPIVVTKGSMRRDVDVTLKDGGVLLTGQVVDAMGGPVADASVSFAQLLPSRVRAQARTDEQGQFSVALQPGPAMLEVSAGGYATSREHAVAPSHIEIALMPAGSAEGTVRSADGELIAGVKVVALPLGSAGLDVGPAALSDDDGHFRIEGLAPDSYVLKAKGGPYQGFGQKPFELELGETIRDLVVTVAQGAEIEGQVLVADGGGPCRQGYVSLGPPDPTWPVDARGKPVLHGEPAIERPGLLQTSDIEVDGSVHFPGVPDGDYYVTVLCLGHVVQTGPRAIHVRGGSHRPLAWTVKQGLYATIRVVDGADRAVPHAPFRLRLPESAQGTSKVLPMMTDSSGSVRVPGLSPGTYQVLPQAEEQGAAVALHVREGAEASATLRLANSAAIEVLVQSEREIASALRVSAQPLDEATLSHRAVNLGGGKFRVGPLKEGRYRVSADDGLNPSTDQEIELRGGQTATLTLRLGNTGSISGEVRDAQGAPLENVWVRAVRGATGASSRRVLSGSEGEFELTGIAPGAQYEVRAEQPGGSAARVEHVEAGRRVVVVVPSAARVRGVVVAENGEPAPQYHIVAHHDSLGSERQAFITDSQGLFALDGISPGAVTLRVSAGELTGELHIQLLANQTQHGLRIPLQRPAITAQAAELLQ